MQASDDPAPPSASDRRRVLIVECVLVATVAIYAASNLPGVRAHAGYSVAWDGWLQNGILVVAAVLVGLRAYRSRDGGESPRRAFPEQVRTLLEVRSLDPSRLMLEVTETDLMADPARCPHRHHP